MSRTLIRVRALSCRLGGKEILRGVDFELREGQSLAVFGPNGAGKSTLLRCLLRIHERSGGRLEILGRELDRLSQRQLARCLSYAPQADRQSSPFQVEDFVALARYPHLGALRAPGPEDRRAIREALETTDTLRFAGRRMDTLSGGERQKVYVAAALAQQSRVLLLDEPASFLDPRQRGELLRILDRCRRELGLSLVYVTHDPNLALALCDSVLGLKEGRVLFRCPGEDPELPARLAELYGRDFCSVAHPGSGRRLLVPAEDPPGEAPAPGGPA